MKRLVDLDRIIESINAVFDSKTAKRVTEYLNNYPVIEPSEWIPVSVALPDDDIEDKWYWCTCYAPHRGYFTQPGQWDGRYGEFNNPCYNGIVIAWLKEMPKPYEP